MVMESACSAEAQKVSQPTDGASKSGRGEGDQCAAKE